jgi:DNA-binding winged helix-turn-helix (wHTH) protein/Tfp pilus assembly protein PilF
MYQFGPFELDPVALRLTRSGAAVPLTTKAVETLVALVERRGDTVSKDELIRRVWPDANVEENNLTQAISRARKALGDPSDRGYYIVTVPGKGYRFVAPVREGATAPLVQDQASTPAARLIVLPFRVLRPDPATDFLASSLPDAITTSLSNLESIVVRSSVTAARFAGETINLESLGAEAAVDMALTGTLLRVGDEIRVNTQLVQVPGGAVLWSQSRDASLADLFQLQDHVTRGIVASLPIRLTARDERLLVHDVPATARAYELYLRANQLSADPKRWAEVRELYLQCLQEDSEYAPAWARLGRIYRVLALYAGGAESQDYGHAQHAFRRALEINPDLSLAHNLYTYLEVELGGASDAMVRLLERARRRPADPEVFAGLVHACRYCGLLDAAIAAYERAHRLDPQIRTSVAHAYWMRGDYEAAIRTDQENPPFAAITALIASGCEGEAVARLIALEALGLPPGMQHYLRGLRAVLESRLDDAATASRALLHAGQLRDPCGRYYVARLLARVGETDGALQMLQATVEGGFFCRPLFERDGWLDPLRGSSAFAEIARAAEVRQDAAERRFRQAGGDVLLGLAG